MKTTPEEIPSFVLLPQEYKKVKFVYRALDHKLRQQVMKYIFDKSQNVTVGENRSTVSELYVHFRTEQSVMSQHLAILRKASLLLTKREGKHIFYQVNKDAVDLINRTSKTIMHDLQVLSWLILSAMTFFSDLLIS